ncbi:putative calcium-transporting ATPase 13, plasma membrane-type [Primulina huaijiensis]|uniref:putative calcium-transporting ATPase 13, plasma membrane-type n=1 Tax=Primulina huaijiensis TaxID=1492673 RepID=UPI003CC713DD
MSSKFQANLHCMGVSVDLSQEVTLSLKNMKRWHSAFAKIQCSMALLSLFREVLAKNHKKILPISPREVVISIGKSRESSHFCNIDGSFLSKIVKEKSIEGLLRAGGVEGIATSLQTDMHRGIVGHFEDILRRTEVFGSNAYLEPPTMSFFHFVWEAFKDPTIIILLVCAALSLGFGIEENGPKEGWYDGGSIIVAVFLVISVSAVSDFKQNRQFEKLSKISNDIRVEVVRNGRRKHSSIFEIVVGDVICLKIGDQVPADGLLVEGHCLQVDESSMTGESDHVEINSDLNPFLVSGTKVVDGYGKMLVTSVGMNTSWGEMMSTMISRNTNEQTPLQERINELASGIGKVGLAIAFLVLVVLLLRYFTGNTEDENGNKEFHGGGTKVDDAVNKVVRIIAASVTILVVAIPEGLPLAVTLTLAYSMKKMVADQAMVRKLSACETMGSATTICTDKTGTLTMNQMEVTTFWLGKESMQGKNHTLIAANVLELLHEGVGLNTTGSIYRPNESTHNIKFSGSPTEKALLSWAVFELNMNMEKVEKDSTVLYVEAFNSEKKRSGLSIKRFQDGVVRAHWKGAAEMILAMCTHYYDTKGNTLAFDDFERLKFRELIREMAASSLRCIAFAYKHVSDTEHGDGEIYNKVQDTGLTFLGLVGLKDPCRPGVKKAVEDCQYAGVHVKMITGDNIFTAKAIATECGILGPNHEINDGSVVEGVEFRNYTEEERMERVEKIRVMARSSPFDKLLMVQCLKKKGHVVAVTGDGTNDAPALKEADIGLSMGIQGTEVAKESSDIVILDDNFASVVTVLKWGRCVYNNIQKFIQFQLTVNVAALVINFVAAVSAGEVPLTAVQLLWLYLIMDTLGALALATEKPAKELTHKKPVGRTEPLITNIMWRNLLAQALYQISVLLILYFRGEHFFQVSKRVNHTLIFNTFVLCQVFNEFNARKLEKKNVFEGIHKNKVFLVIIGVTLILQVAMVEFLEKFADTERLSWGQWGICAGIAAVSWPIGWLVKCLPVPKRPLFSLLKSALKC